jgi:hypothetical protein
VVLDRLTDGHIVEQRFNGDPVLLITRDVDALARPDSTPQRS